MARPVTPRETNPDAMFDAPNLRVYIHKAATAHLLNALGRLCERPEGLTEEIKELCGLLQPLTERDGLAGPVRVTTCTAQKTGLADYCSVAQFAGRCANG